jgi:hypothetical protein
LPHLGTIDTIVACCCDHAAKALPSFRRSLDGVEPGRFPRVRGISLVAAAAGSKMKESPIEQVLPPWNRVARERKRLNASNLGI